jgi:hypothetical protein
MEEGRWTRDETAKGNETIKEEVVVRIFVYLPSEAGFHLPSFSFKLSRSYALTFFRE